MSTVLKIAYWAGVIALVVIFAPVMIAACLVSITLQSL